MASAALRALFIHDFERATQSALGAANQEQRANRVNRRSLPANDFAHVRGMDPQLIDRQPVAFGGGDSHGIRPINQPFHHVIQKSFHNRQYLFGR